MSNNVKLKKKAPSPVGEGWGEENKNRENAPMVMGTNIIKLSRHTGRDSRQAILPDVNPCRNDALSLNSQLVSGEIKWK